jgi:predicted ATPase
MQGQGAEGLAMIQQGGVALPTIQQDTGRTWRLAMLAEGYGTAGQVDVGLQALDEALAIAERRGERRWETELYRLKGELLLQGAVDHRQEAEASLQQALTIARHQQAKSWELRAALSLGRLWQRQGKRAAAHQLLAEVYGWFTEGFDTADLQEAQALLEDLAG